MLFRFANLKLWDFCLYFFQMRFCCSTFHLRVCSFNLVYLFFSIFVVIFYYSTVLKDRPAIAEILTLFRGIEEETLNLIVSGALFLFDDKVKMGN